MTSAASLFTKFSNRVALYLLYNDLNQLKSNVSLGICERQFHITFRRPAGENDEKETNNVVLPPEPQDCCMSGCANCVWIKYAEEVAKLLGNGVEVAKAKIIENVKDPNLRAFLMIELEDLLKKKEEK